MRACCGLISAGSPVARQVAGIAAAVSIQTGAARAGVSRKQMAIVVTLSGSPSPTSRSQGLLLRSIALLEERGIEVKSFSLADFDADALLFGHFENQAIRDFQKAVAEADGLIVATPVYKAAYSAGLKALLDVLPERALARHVVLPLATGGSASHMLAVDYSLQPVLTALKAHHILGAVYATEKDVHRDEHNRLRVTGEIDERLLIAVERFASLLPHRKALPSVYAGWGAARISS
jgi:FMN reductase